MENTISFTIQHTSKCSYYQNGNWCDCGARESFKLLEALPEAEFQTFFKSLPVRVQMLVNSGMVDWREVLPQWYAKLSTENATSVLSKVE